MERLLNVEMERIVLVCIAEGHAHTTVEWVGGYKNMKLLTPLPESPDNKALRELRDELKNLNKTINESIKASDRISRVLVWVGVLQFVVGLFQFATSLFGPQKGLVALIVEIIAGAGLIIAAVSLAKSLGLESKKDIK